MDCPDGQPVARPAERVRQLDTAYRRFRDWREADVFKAIFGALSSEPDMEYAMVDATIVKVYRHGQGAKGGLKARPSVAPKVE